MALSTRLLTLRKSPILLQLPPYLSALCIIIGIAWLFLLPLNEYSRQTYVSENAILPGQVHTYFGGSEHNLFRAYRQEVYKLAHWAEADRNAALENILRSNGLKTAQQAFRYTIAGEDVEGTNIYGLLQGPRADATEAMVLIAAWRTFDNETNYSGVALALTLARYFKRWSIWSKDIILLLPPDSTYGPQAWVSAYHTTPPVPTLARNVSALPLKAGALQAALALDYPAGPWGKRFDKLDILYDGLNGALPNLDLLNTAVSIASGQMGIACTLHSTPSHSDSYADRLTTLAKGVFTQASGHATGPHSAFVPYHVDAITLKTVGDGWHDEMSLGRTTESVFRSINNLLEHLHQSFFFYLLLNANRFVSIGDYLPAAMLVAGSFTITALALWVRSSRAVEPSGGAAKESAASTPDEKRGGLAAEMEIVKFGDDIALVPKPALQAAVLERKIFLPALVVLGVHLAGFIPLYLLDNLHRSHLPVTLQAITATTTILPAYLATILTRGLETSAPQFQITQSLSLLTLGAAISTLTTLNFSLAFLIGVLASPLNFLRPLPRFSAYPSSLQSMDQKRRYALDVGVPFCAALLHAAIAPPVVVYALSWYCGRGIEGLLMDVAKGWGAQGVYTGFVVWVVWWPAWVLGGVVLLSGVVRKST